MNLFYFDEVINEYEHQLNFSPIIHRLEKQFKKNRDSKTLSTIIGCSWFYFVEGNVKKVPYNYDKEFLMRKWKEYVDIGLSDFYNNSDVCLIIAYSLNLHWFYLGKKYGNIYLDLYKRSIELSRGSNIGKLAYYFLEHKLFSQIGNSKAVCQDLFPTESALDMYFRQILNLVMVS
ncbi:hypothetical protein RJI07_05200 [Mycoplasmatota bacterium WC30]